MSSSVPRVRRSRPSITGALPPQEASTPGPARIRRTRPTTDALGRTRYLIDWEGSLGGKLQLYLMSSFLYYYMNRSLITDSDFDRLCKELAAGWRSFDHPHKSLTDREQLRAGTGYAIKYPAIVRNAAAYMLERHYEL